MYKKYRAVILRIGENMHLNRYFVPHGEQKWCTHGSISKKYLIFAPIRLIE
jgi:hypothetical protein